MKNPKTKTRKLVRFQRSKRTSFFHRINSHMVQRFNKKKCLETFVDQIEQIESYREEIIVGQYDIKYTAILIANVKSPGGTEMAKIVLPRHNWQQYSHREEIFARGLVDRECMMGLLGFADEAAKNKLDSMADIPVIIFDHSVVEIFSIPY